MKHISINDFFPQNHKKKVADDGVRAAANEQGKTEPVQPRRDNGGVGDKELTGSSGTDGKQTDANTQPDGPSNVQTDLVDKSGTDGDGGKTSKTSTKDSK